MGEVEFSLPLQFFAETKEKYKDMTAKEYDRLPSHIKEIVNDYNDSGDLYHEAERIRSKLNAEGWDCDYDLSGTIFDVKPKLTVAHKIF